MVKINKGIVSATPVQKRWVKSATSGFGLSSAAGTPTGSSAMPHFGQSRGVANDLRMHRAGVLGPGRRGRLFHLWLLDQIVRGIRHKFVVTLY